MSMENMEIENIIKITLKEIRKEDLKSKKIQFLQIVLLPFIVTVMTIWATLYISKSEIESACVFRSNWTPSPEETGH